MNRAPLQKISENTVRKSFEAPIPIFQDDTGTHENSSSQTRRSKSASIATKKFHYNEESIEALIEKINIQNRQIDNLEKENHSLKQRIQSLISTPTITSSPAISRRASPIKSPEPMKQPERSLIHDNTPQKRSRLETEIAADTKSGSASGERWNVKADDKIYLPSSIDQNDHLPHSNISGRSKETNLDTSAKPVATKEASPPESKQPPSFPSINQASKQSKEDILSFAANESDLTSCDLSPLRPQHDSIFRMPQAETTNRTQDDKNKALTLNDRIRIARESSLKVLFRNMIPQVDLTELQRKRLDRERATDDSSLKDFTLPIGVQSPSYEKPIPLTELPYVQEKIHIWKELYKESKDSTSTDANIAHDRK
jgi:hypothetical protein